MSSVVTSERSGAESSAPVARASKDRIQRMQAVRGSSMSLEKWLCWSSLGVAGLMLSANPALQVGVTLNYFTKHLHQLTDPDYQTFFFLSSQKITEKKKKVSDSFLSLLAFYVILYYLHF